jgi:hypothetical protein
VSSKVSRVRSMVLTESPDESGWLQATGRVSGRDLTDPALP